MKKLRFTYAMIVVLATLIGCSKNEADFDIPEQLDAPATRLKTVNEAVSFGALGSVQFISSTITKGQPYAAATTFVYRIFPGSVPVTGLDLLVSICTSDPVINSCTNASAVYGTDRFLRAIELYKSKKWLMLNEVVDVSQEITFKLNGVWYAEPRTAILKGKSIFVAQELPVPVCQPNAGLAIVETMEVFEDAGNLVVTAKITNPGVPPFYACGVIWNQVTVPFYPADGGNMVPASAMPADYIFTTVIEDANVGSTCYIRAYALNSWFPYEHDLGIGYGNLLAFKPPLVNAGDPVKDQEGNVYQTVIIGDQTWMAENLRYLPYVNPVIVRKQPVKDPIYVYGYTGTNTAEAKATDNYRKYGALYSHKAALTSCPTGWHLPSDEEWLEMEAFLGMQESDLSLLGWDKVRLSGNLGELLKSPDGWTWGAGYSHAVGTNSTGFTARAGGSVYPGTSGPIYSDIGSQGRYWTSTQVPDKAYYRGFTFYDQRVDRNSAWLPTGHSVRCVKD